ncbi:MAG: hypothetical protein H7A51_14905 [Akkermansiaceae bacterium]|nr:hypothetical protein [Akkermansiaceae bacterium]
MNFTTIDWLIVAAFLLFLVVTVVRTNKHTQSVSDFLAGGRSGGRYMMSAGSGMVWIGAINIIAMFELYHGAGFVAMWMVMLTTPFYLALNISGFGVCRFRETRALTVAQFVESRYSKGLRITSGVIAWIAGLINFGIFPAVGAKFFISFCGFPNHFQCLGLSLETFPVAMITLLAASLFFVFFGGHIAVLVTDCLQGMFTQVASLIILVVVAYLWFDWTAISKILLELPEEGKSLVSPFKAGAVEDFNVWYFVIGIVGAYYGVMSNLQNQAYVASAKSGHEFRMGSVLNQWRWLGQCLFYMVLVLCAMNVMHNPAHAEQAGIIQEKLSHLSEADRGQRVITVALTQIMPIGIAGLFCTIMLAALISTYDSFMHTWGAVFLQDVVMPFRKKRFTPRSHMWALRGSIILVCVFAFLWSYYVGSMEKILMYFALVNSIWLGGAGAIIIGGLYWKRGTSKAAWAALITGVVIGAFSYVVTEMWTDVAPLLGSSLEDFPLNPQVLFFVNIVSCTILYVCISLIENKEHNMDKMLHRGKYGIEGDQVAHHGDASTLQKCFGITSEFTFRDRLIAYAIVGWFVAWLLVFVVGTLYGFVADPSDQQWLAFWYVYLWCLGGLAVVTTVWFTLGGVRDLKDFYHAIRHIERDHTDDGFVDHEEKE